MKKFLAILLVALLLTGIAPSRHAHAANGERCFGETGFCISGRIRQYWENNGGLPVFGFPKSAQGPMVIEGKTFQAQNFERNRLELHPENAAPYDVLLGRLGALNMMSVFNAETSDVIGKIDFNTESFSEGGLLKDSSSCKWFEQTQQFVCNEFLTYWKSHGLQLDGKPGFAEAESLALFGLPLSYRFTTTLEGTPRIVQIFERARFELHEDKPEPYRVLLGLLGNQYLGGNAPAAAGAPVTNDPVQTGEMHNFIRFDLGTNITSIEIASAGSERWLSFVDTKTNNSVQANSGSVWAFTIPIFDNKKIVDIRLNNAVVWRNVEVRENSLVVLGYKNTPDFVGPYIVSIQDNYR